MMTQGLAQLGAAKALALAWPLGIVALAMGGVLSWERHDQRRLSRLLDERRALRRLERKVDRFMAGAAPASRAEAAAGAPEREAAALPVSPTRRVVRQGSGAAGKSEILRLIVEENVRLREAT